MQKLLLIKSDINTEEALRKILNEHGFSVNLMPLDSLLVKMQEEVKEKDSGYMKCGDIELDENTMTVKVSGEPIKLTAQEYKLFRYMMINKNRVIERDQLLARIWGYNTEVNTRVVDVYMGYLRKKIDKNFGTDYIQSVRGFGFMLVDPNEEPRL